MCHNPFVSGNSRWRKGSTVGTWGPGNFDNDAARDHLFDLTRGLAYDIEQSLDRAAALKLAAAESLDSDLAATLETVLPNINILCVLHESLDGSFVPEPATVDDWHARFEQLSPECHAGHDTNSAERRDIIQATFAKLRQFAQQCWDE